MSTTKETGYVAPTGDEVRDLLSRMGLTGSAAGELVGHKDKGRQTRRYTGGGTKMPFAILYTLLSRHSDCKVTPENWREEVFIQPKEADKLKGLRSR